MQTKLQLKNIVLIGHFEPMTFDKYFFIKNKIVSEEEILPISSFTNPSTRVSTKSIDILINANQIIINSKNIENEPDLSEIADQIKNTLTLIIKIGQITSIDALGLNFHYVMSGFSSLEAQSKFLFYNDKSELLTKFFNKDDSVYGLYASTNFKNARLKLEIKPAKLQEINQPAKDIIIFIFNYHFENNNKNNSIDVLSNIADFSEYENNSKEIISIYKK